MPQAGHSIAHLFCEKEGSCMKTSKNEKNRELQKVCDGVTDSTLSGRENAKKQK